MANTRNRTQNEKREPLKIHGFSAALIFDIATQMLCPDRPGNRPSFGALFNEFHLQLLLGLTNVLPGFLEPLFHIAGKTTMAKRTNIM